MQDNAGVKILPPLLLLAGLGLSVAAALLSPGRLLQGGVSLPLGLLLVAASLGLLAAAALQLRAANTAFDVRKPTTRARRRKRSEEEDIRPRACYLGRRGESYNEPS